MLLRATSAETRDVRLLAAAQSRGGLPVIPARAQPSQLTLDLGDTPELAMATGLPEMTGPGEVGAELDILGLDAGAHIVDFYAPMLEALGGDPSRAAPRTAKSLRAVGRRGQGRHANTAGPFRGRHVGCS